MNTFDFIIWILVIVVLSVGVIYLLIYIYASIKAERMARKELGLKCGEYSMGMCHTIWLYKKQTLKKFGINWKSPADKHPDTLFD